MQSWYWGEAAPTAAPQPDLLTAADDLLLERLTACSLCGQAQRRQGGIWIGTATRTLAVAYAFCERCAAREQESRRMLDERLRERYGATLAK